MVVADLSKNTIGIASDAWGCKLSLDTRRPFEILATQPVQTPRDGIHLMSLLTIVAIIVGLPFLYIFVQTIAAIIRFSLSKQPTSPSTPLPMVVVIPAHDEGAGIITTIKSVQAAVQSDHADVEIVVIADNCRDDTAANAREAGVRVLERQHATERGKGYALAWAVEQLSSEPRWRAAVFIDADARPFPGFFTAFAAAFANGRHAMQAFNRCNAEGGIRIKLNALSFALINCARPLGRFALGGSANISGNGFALSRECLAQVPFKPSGALAEDLEHGLALVEAGIVVESIPGAIIEAIGAAEGAAATTQRTRWEAGRLRATLVWLPRLLRRGSGRSLEAAADLLVPPLALPVLAQSIIVICALAFGDQLALIVALSTCGLLFIALALACRIAGIPLVTMFSLLFAPWYIAWKMLIYLKPRFWTERSWVRTARSFALVAVLLLSGCARSANNNPEPDLTQLLVTPPAQVPAIKRKTGPSTMFPARCREQFAKLRVGDTVRLTLDGDARFEAGLERTIDPLGRVTLPLAGFVQCEGLLPEEFANKVDEEMKAWFSDPHCEVLVTTRSDRSVIVIGAVAKQGLIKLDCDDTMVGVLAKAGGVAERPSSLPGRTIMPREARVLRDGNLALIDLDPLLNGLDAAADIAVAPGDIIQVQPGDLQTVVVLGEVARPGPVTMAPGMDIMQVIALAGGPTEDAKPSEACVVRGWWKADGAQLLPINLDKVMYEAGDNTPGLRDRDLIIVPRSGIAAMGYFLEKVSPALNTIVLIKALAQ